MIQRTNKDNQDKDYIKDAEIWFSSLVADENAVYDVNKAFIRFQKRVKSCMKRDYWMLRWSSVAAAAVVLLITCSAGYWFYQRTPNENTLSEIIVEVPLGSINKITLPDGTAAWLNAGSKLVLSKGFGISNRNLQLQGEGYFEVVKNRRMPFKVHSKELNVEVLGTKFNIRNYPEDEELSVDLVEGKVAVENCMHNKDRYFLEPFEKVILNKQTGCIKKNKHATQHANEWTQELLSFDESLLGDIVKELERSYSIQIHVLDKSILGLRFYGEFDKRKQSVQDILDIMCSTGQLKYEVNDHEIILKSTINTERR